MEHVSPRDTVFDVGSHTGYYTLLAAGAVGRHGRVWAFEPDPTNAGFLRRHVRINDLDNVRVEEAAVTDREGVACFGGGSGSGTGRLLDSGEISVRTSTLDGTCQRHDLRPSLIKMDIEGGEYAALCGSNMLMRWVRPVILLSTHGSAGREACLTLLDELEYYVDPVGASSVTSANEFLCRPTPRRTGPMGVEGDRDE